MHLLSREAIEADILVSRSEQHMRELFSQLALTVPLLAAVGGDTTFTIMAQEFWQKKQESGRDVAEMAWIGVGSANDILRGEGLVRVETAVAALKKGLTREISLGELIDDRGEFELFLGSVAFGAAPRVNEAIARARLRGCRGTLSSEWLPGLRTLWQAYRRGDLPIDFELVPRSARGLSGTASLILLLNMPHFSRGIVVNDFAALDTAVLDWTVVASDSLLSLWGMQRRLARSDGKVGHPDIQVGQDVEGKLCFMTPQRYIVDGELRGPVRELTFRVLPRALRLRVPLGEGLEAGGKV
jgi:diacylglycerol kinase family enzyme